MNRRLNFDKARVERVKSRVEETTKKMDEINRLMGSLNSAKSSFEVPANFLAERGKWTDILNELQTLLPDSMWLTKLEAIGDTVPGQTDAAPVPQDTPFGPFGGGMMQQQQRQKQEPGFVDIPEAKQLHLVGYTLVLKGRDLLENELQQKIKKSKYFSNDDDGSILDKYEQETEVLNLTSFEMRLKLKEPVKK